MAVTITMTDERTQATRALSLDMALRFLGNSERSSHRDHLAALLTSGTALRTTNFRFIRTADQPADQLERTWGECEAERLVQSPFTQRALAGRLPAKGLDR